MPGKRVPWQGVLTYTDILKLIRPRGHGKRPVIENAAVELVNGSSIDITLGNRIIAEGEIEEWLSSRITEIDFRRRDSLPSHAIDLDPEEGYLLRPGEFILAGSQQVFNLPCTISADYKLKSSMARIGLQHLNAGWCDPGWNGSVLTMELVNVTRSCSIRIRPGDRIGQMVFFRHCEVPSIGNYARRGRYNGDTVVKGIKP